MASNRERYLERKKQKLKDKRDNRKAVMKMIEDTPDMCIIELTMSILHVALTAGSMNAEQLEILGVKETSKGWLKNLVGKKISKEKLSECIRIKSIFPFKKSRARKLAKKTFQKSAKKKSAKKPKMTRREWYYEVYLKSDLWKEIKSRVLKRDSRRCRMCSAKAVVVHHNSYAKDVLDGLDDSKLASLCDPCHHHLHFDSDDEKRPFVDVHPLFLSILERRYV